jgi:hypothetical protein
LGVARLLVTPNQPAFGPVKTHHVRGGKLNKGFRVNRAREVVVQIASLGHLLQEREQSYRILTDGVEIARSLFLWRMFVCRPKSGRHRYDHRQTPDVLSQLFSHPKASSSNDLPS